MKKRQTAKKHSIIKTLWNFIMHLFKVDLIGRAAQTAFFWLLSFFPLLLFASAALTRLEITPDWTNGIIPEEITGLLSDASMPDFSSPWLFLASAWAASAGIWALMKGVKQVYNHKPLGVGSRFLAILFTVGFVAVLALTLTLIFTQQWLGLVASAAAIYALILSLYYFTPGTLARFRRCAWTAAIATACWVITSRLFEIYLRLFSNYTVVYGSIGAFLGLALWLFIICIVILVCAEISGYDFRPPSVRKPMKKAELLPGGGEEKATPGTTAPETSS